MGLFRRNRRDPEPATPEPDLYERTRDRLWVEAANNPRLAALLTEMERGRARATKEGGDVPELQEDPRAEAPKPLHAHEITPADAAVLRMLAGSHWGPEARLTLPSGRVVTGDEVARWVKEEGR